MIHEFTSTRAAYDASQCYVDTGDVLYVPSENVAGVSYTWPFAITDERGGACTELCGWRTQTLRYGNWS